MVNGIRFVGNRPESVEKNLKKSLADLNLSYVDLYLIHVPFGFPESESGPLRHPNGDLVLDLTTDHVAVWKVRITQLYLALFKYAKCVEILMAE